MLGTDAAVSLGVVLVAAAVVCLLAVGAGGFVIDRLYSGDGP